MDTSNAPTLLVVDDDPDIRDLMRVGLESAGFNVMEAGSGEAALELARTGGIDLALLDINMAGISGVEVAKRLHAETTIPFIFNSGISDRETVRLAIATGALGYFLKPFDIQRLLPTIETALVRAKDIQRLKDAQLYLDRAKRGGKTVDLAIGLVMERFRLREEDAVRFLEKRAMTEKTDIEQVCVDIIRAASILTGH